MMEIDENAFMREVEEDMARKKAEAFWRQNGPLILGCALFIVLMTAAYTGWQTYTVKRDQAVTGAYLELMTEKEKGTKSPHDLIKAFATFAQEKKGTTQAVFAKMQAASLSLNAGEKDKALVLYDQVAQDSKADRMYRQLGDLMYVQTDMDTGDAAKLRARLEPLMKEGAWQPMAYEFAAHLALREGQKDEAKKLFTKLKELPSLTSEIAQRTDDMLAWLNKDKGSVQE